MSHAVYNQKWAECMQDLAEQVQIEYLPVTAAETGQPFEVGFQHYALLQIKYLQIYKKLEDCYDQMVHPQKRRSIKTVLECVIVRILELRQHLIYFNPRAKNHFIALDEVLTDLKLNPEVVEWQIPRYFLDDKERADEIEVGQKKLDHWLKMFNLPMGGNDLADKKDPFQVDLSIDQAIRIIQKNERGRIGIQRAVMVSDWRKDALRKEERQKKALNEKDGDDLADKQTFAATYIASHWRRKVERVAFQQMKENEFQFLGVSHKEHEGVDQIAIANEIRQKRKREQMEADDMYERALMDELENQKLIEGPDIRLNLLEERRNWILDYRQEQAKFPETFEEFYKPPEAAGEPEEPEPAAAKKDDKKDKKDDKKGDKKDAKNKAPEVEEEEHQVGTSPLVQQFVELIEEYTEKWENRNESTNFEQKHDLKLCQEKVYPIVETRIRQVVDNEMVEELANLKTMYDKKKKEKKGKKKGGKGKKGKKDKKGKVKKWCAAVGMVTNRDDCFPELVEQGMLIKIKPEYMKNIHGEFHYLGAFQRVQETYCPPPSMQMAKSLVIEHCLLPLASTAIRQKAPYAARSLLLYGPKGSGKSMMARAIATEVGATFFDISPSVIEGKYTQPKIGAPLLIYKTFIAAQDSAPSIIYMDNIEMIFQAAKKKKGGDADAPVRIKKDLVAAIKQIKTGKESVDQDRILFIGCTNKPFADNMDTKELLNSFDEKVWISFPDYASRTLLWKKCIELHEVKVDTSKVNLSSLAHVSEGYSSGSIRQTVDRVLTTRRLQSLKTRPLAIQEFLGPLSRTSYLYPEEWKQFREFDHLATGEKERMDKLAAASGEAPVEEKGKDKGKKK